MKLSICNCNFYIWEIMDLFGQEGRSSLLIKSTKVRFCPDDSDFMIFKIDGRNHGERRYVRRFFILTKSLNFSSIILEYPNKRPKWLEKSIESFRDEFNYFAEMPRILLCRVSPGLKDWYSSEKECIKIELEKLLKWKKE